MLDDSVDLTVVANTSSGDVVSVRAPAPRPLVAEGEREQREALSEEDLRELEAVERSGGNSVLKK